MRRVVGFGLFWFSGGMVFNMLLPNLFVEILCAALFVLAAYELFCCKR